jgi:hypothetical protein
MANWAHVQNGEIKELHDNLPMNWKNISGLRHSVEDINFLNSIGWFKVEKQYENFDESVYQISGFNYSINANQVIETYNLIQKEIEEVVSKTREELFYALREIRNNKLKESDWTQLQDVSSNFIAEEKRKWNNYRQKLRNLPKQYEDVDFNKIEEIVWPEY